MLMEATAVSHAWEARRPAPPCDGSRGRGSCLCRAAGPRVCLARPRQAARPVRAEWTESLSPWITAATTPSIDGPRKRRKSPATRQLGYPADCRDTNA